METKHTPGPWRPVGLPIEAEGFRITGGGAYAIARIPQGSGAAGDAQLIAAAPRLLEALTILVAGVEVAGLHKDIPTAYEMALEALAEATGGKS